jgi:acyl dehydratase
MPENTTPRYFEDFQPGAKSEFGDRLVTEADIIRFATEFDPQPFHIDREAAKDSIYGGVIASGWHTAAMMMRMLCDHAIPTESAMGSPGLDELNWLKPVRPGDRLRCRSEVLSAVRSRGKPDRGLVRSRTEIINQHDEVVMSVVSKMFHRLRDPSVSAM